MKSSVTKVSIIGGGSWGTAVALVIAETHPEISVCIWAHEPEVVESINSRNENEMFSPGVMLPSNITAVSTIKEAVLHSDVVILATPSKVLVDIMFKIRKYLQPNVCVSYLSKGFCKVNNEIFTISQSFEKLFPKMKHKIVAISGPSHAEEVLNKCQTCLNIGSKNKRNRELIAKLLTSDYVECRTTDDVVGVELGGTLKNPAAIAAGIISVLADCGDNLTGALISEALKEMTALAVALQAKPETIIDISGLGDLAATVTSSYSRNRRFGQDIGNQIISQTKHPNFIEGLILKFRPQFIIEEIAENVNYLVEGAYSIEPIIELSEKHDVSIPVYRSLYEVLLNKKDLSLLVETIKHPTKYDEIYSKTKIQIGEKKRGFESVQGNIFKNIITEKVVENNTLEKSCSQNNKLIEELIAYSQNLPKQYKNIKEKHLISQLNSTDLPQKLKKLTLYYAKMISDNYIFLLNKTYLYSLKLIKLLGAIITGNGLVSVKGNFREIYALKDSTNIVYLCVDADVNDFVVILNGLSSKRLPIPRFYLSTFAVKCKFIQFLLKLCGGFIINEEKFSNKIYKESVAVYLSTMLENGLPILYYPYGPANEFITKVNDKDFYKVLADTMFRHTIELAIIPVSCASEVRITKNGLLAPLLFGAKIRLGDVIFLSEFTKNCNDSKELALKLKHEFDEMRKAKKL